MKLPGLKLIITLFLIAIMGLIATGCSENKAIARDKAQADAKQTGESQEIKNLKLKREREEDPNTLRYVYIFAFGSNVPIGYYVAKGKISSNSSQIGPELELSNNSYRDSSVLDSSKDDGSYGTGDPGIFFFLTDGTLIEHNMYYIQSDNPNKFPNVPRLYE